MNKNVPNILTVARVIAVPFFVVCYYKQAFLAALIIFCLASLTDMLDGKIARKYNLVSNFGKIMDPLADKVLTYTAMLLFIERGIKFWPAWMLAIVLLREFLVAGLRAVAASQGIVIAADIFGKIKTVMQMAAIIGTLVMLASENGRLSQLYGFSYRFSMVAAYGALIMTVVSGYNYTIKNIQVFKDEVK